MKSDAWDIPLLQNVTSTIYNNNILLCKQDDDDYQYSNGDKNLC